MTTKYKSLLICILLITGCNEDISILGTDINSNGIRDDVDQYINSQQATIAQKKSLSQAAIAITDTLTMTPKTHLNVATNLSNASSCLYSQFTANEAHDYVLAMQDLVVNTNTREKAYNLYNTTNINGIPSPDGDGCI